MPTIRNLPTISTATENTLIPVVDVDDNPDITKKISFDQLRDYFLGYVGSGDRRGYTGSQGYKGYAGSRGFRGLPGYTGSHGYIGSRGFLGYNGSRGYTGSASTVPGPIGYSGSIGYTGSAATVIYGSYVHTQTTATSTWIVNHSLGTRFCNVEVINTASQSLVGTYDYPTITFNNTTTLTLSFGYNISGYAALSMGHNGYAGSRGFVGYIGSSGYTGSQGLIGYTGSAVYNGGTVTNQVIVTDTTPSTSVSSGAVIVSGGIGVNGTVNSLRSTATISISTPKLRTGSIETTSTTATIYLKSITRIDVSSSPLRVYNVNTGLRDSLSAENGDIIYNTDTNRFQGYANGLWVNLN